MQVASIPHQDLTCPGRGQDKRNPRSKDRSQGAEPLSAWVQAQGLIGHHMFLMTFPSTLPGLPERWPVRAPGILCHICSGTQTWAGLASTPHWPPSDAERGRSRPGFGRLSCTLIADWGQGGVDRDGASAGARCLLCGKRVLQTKASMTSSSPRSALSVRQGGGR